MDTDSKGFTLVELLVVVSIIGVLSALVLGSLNYTRQQGRARDAVKIKTLSQLAEGFKALQVSENRLPYGCSGNPMDAVACGSPQDYIKTYISAWPGNDYFYRTESTYMMFMLCTESSETPGSFIKYFSPNHIHTSPSCRDKILIRCSTNCSGFTPTNCTTLEGISC